MAITSVNEIWQGRSGGTNFEARRFTRVFQVITDNKFDTSVQVTFTGTPVIGDLHPSDNGAFCQDVDARQQPFSPTVWIVTCSYSSKNENVVKDKDNPLNDTAQITWTTEQFQRVVAFDRNDDAVLNSAGQIFDPPLMVDDTRVVVNIVTNQAFVPTWIIETPDTLNSTTVTIDGLTIAPEKAKVKTATVSPQKRRNNINYRTVSLSIALNRKGWQPKLLDIGFTKVDPNDSTKRIAITQGDGTTSATPDLLDGSGGVVTDPSFTSAVSLTFDVFETFDFNLLPLG